MPRVQSYIPSANYKKMEDIIDELLKDGATRSEANISSLTAKLIDLGLILYEVQNKKEASSGADAEDGGNVDASADTFLKENMTVSVRTELYAQVILQILLDPSVINEAESYKQIKSQIKTNAERLCKGIIQEPQR